MNYSPQQLPLYLTLSRCILGLGLMPLLIVHALSYDHWFFTLFTTIVFVGLSVTDFFDGYYARKYGCETALGKMLDPLADKMLMIATLVALLEVGYIHYYAVIVLLAREIIISGLRTVASQHTVSLNVIWLAKVKTFLFSVYCVCAFWAPFHTITIVLLWATIGSSLVSAVYYTYSLITALQGKMTWLG